MAADSVSRGQAADAPANRQSLAQPSAALAWCVALCVALPTSLPAEPAADAELLAAAAAGDGDPLRGAEVFARHTLACLSCHRIGEHGGEVGPALDRIGKTRSAAEIADALLHPQREVEPAYRAVVVQTTDGRTVRGYPQPQVGEAEGLAIRDPVSRSVVHLRPDQIETIADVGSLMPDRLLDSLAAGERQDLVRFLADQGWPERLPMTAIDAVLRQAHAGVPAVFTWEREPLQPLVHPAWQEPVNRERVYDFYTKEARFFRDLCPRPVLTPPFPGLEGPAHGHWGTQNEDTWRSNQWNEIEAGSLQSGVLHAFGETVRRAVCVQLADGLSACFDPDTLSYPVVWQDGFVTYSDVRAGFLGGLTAAGTRLDYPATPPSGRELIYEGFCRQGNEVGFLYRVDGILYLNVPRAEAGRFVPLVAPLAEHPCRHFLAGGPPQWPQVIETVGQPGSTAPFAVDRLTLPHDNPWRARLYCGGHDFLPDGGIVVCTIQGDVWRVDGVDPHLKRLRWRRIAAGLHQPLGLLVVDGTIHVLGRDQITRLHDANADGEIDRYECFSKAYTTSAGGHDYVMGLERDEAGRFLTASSNQGLLRIAADGRTVEVLATGLRNPDGLGIAPDGMITVASSEGEWVPASMVAAVRPDRDPLPLHFGHGGPKGEHPPALPLAYLPRGMDNSSGGQVWLPEGSLGPLGGQFVHLSFGAGTAFLLLRDAVAGQLQGAIVPLPVEFRSGAHRGRYRPADGCLYISGMGGWGTYTPDPGCLERVRYVGGTGQAAMPTGFHVHDNGIVVRFAEPVDPAVMADATRQFAQCWNYRYSPGYGSPEFSTRHEGVRGHDHLPIRSCRVFDDGRAVFLEIPSIAPVNQLQLCLETAPGILCDLVVTVHALDRSFQEAGIPPRDTAHPPHPILADLARLGRREPNPFGRPIEAARAIEITVGPNLSFLPRSIDARPGEPLELTLLNPDGVPHNWALTAAGSLERVGEMVNRLISDPAAAARQYIPATDDVLAYTDIVAPQSRQTIHFRAPAAPGRYPFLCTFPGHWMVMNGELVVAESR